MAIQIKIDNGAVYKKVSLALETKAAPIAYKRAYSLFIRAKNTMLKDFNEHPVTLELKAGARALNTSNTLDGYGNLYSFIGFPEGTDPIGPLKDLLDLGTSFRKTVFRDNAWYFKISTPSKKSIELFSPMPWETGNSWVYGIEEGISNLSYYLYKKSGASRSGMGLQEVWQINDELVFRKTKYLTEILNNFRDRINNSKINL
jgi:hypothetical protein